MDRIFLPIEIKAREFHSKILFSLYAAEYGFEVILGGQSELFNRLSAFGQGLYIDKSVAVTRRDRFLSCRFLGNHLAAWHEEGLIYHSDEVYHATRMDKEAFDMTDVYFAWGQHEAKTILNRYPHVTGKVVVTGNPRLDLLRPNLRIYCRSLVDSLKEKYGSIILINTNFALYNFYNGLDGGIRVFDKYPLAEDHKFKSEYYEFARMGYERFMEAVPIIRKTFPQHTIIIRPAPVENPEPWIGRFGNQEKTVVTKEGNAIEWIQAADAVVQFNCTTGVESFLLGTPSIAYRCGGSSSLEAELPTACSLSAISLDELLDQLRYAIVDIKGGKASFIPRPDQQAVIDSYFPRNDGRTACERILDVLKSREFPPPSICRENVSMPKRIWRTFLRRVRRPDPEAMRYYQSKFPGLSVQEVRKIADRFSNAVGRFGRVNISSAGHNIVKISPF